MTPHDLTWETLVDYMKPNLTNKNFVAALVRIDGEVFWALFDKTKENIELCRLFEDIE